MAIVNVNDMFREMKSIMENNFDGSAEQRYEQAKRLYLENVLAVIEANKEDLIDEMKEKMGV